MDDLDPIEPHRALQLYLADRRNNVSEATIQSHRSRLSFFVDWLNEHGLDNLNDLTGRMVKEYQLAQRERRDWAPVTEKTQLDTVRVFVRWAESIEAVTPDLSERVQSPDLDEDANVRTEELDTKRAEKVLDHLRKYRYCSLQHVTLEVIWHSMCRRGAARSLDVRDYDSDNQHLRFKHRPETGTPLKNGKKSNRYVAIADHIADLLDDWLENQRPDVTDEYGRQPLLASDQGRIHQTTVMQYAYCNTRPCVYGGCPIGRDEETCPATAWDKASSCPESVSPHPIRRGAITHHLRSDVPDPVVSDRADVSEKVIDKHYDERSGKEKMEQRRRFLDNI